MDGRPSKTTLALLFTGVLLSALDIAIVGPALPAIQAAFGVDGAALAWVFNVYILFALIGSPLMAKLSDRYGRRGVYVGCLFAFGVGSVTVAAAPQFGVLLLGRAVQAFGAGGLLPVASAVVADTFAVERRGSALGLLGAVFGVAFVIGPVLGGLLLPFGWQWLFVLNLPIVAAVAFGAWRILPAEAARRRAPFDWAGAGLLAAGLAAFALGLGRLEAGNWLDSLASADGLPVFAVALIAMLAFWRVERRHADPILHPGLFRSTPLKAVAAIAAATGLVEASLVFLPAFSVDAFGVDAGTASFMMLPLVATLVVGAPAAGRLLDRVGPRPVIQAGLAATALGLLLFGVLPLGFGSFYLAGALVGFGLSGLLGAPLRFVALQEAGEARRGESQGFLSLFLSAGRIVGAALIGGMVASGPSEAAGFRGALVGLSVIACAALLGSLALPKRDAARAAAPATDG